MIEKVDGFAIDIKWPGHLFICFYINLSETSAPGAVTDQVPGILVYKDQKRQMCMYQQDGE